MLHKQSETSSICPLCSCKSGTILQTFNSKSTVSHLNGDVLYEKSDFIKKHVEKLWKTDTCYFILCDNCKLSYASPFIAGDQIFYQTVYDQSSKYPKWKWEFDTTFNKIKRLASISSSTLLEIGAGNGSFVKKLSQTTIDPNNILTTEFSTIGKSAIEKLGIKCIEAELWDICLTENKEKFEFICMFQVLEHMSNLEKVFKSLSFLAKKNGHIFIAVPNNYNRELFESIGLIEDIPPTHISRWNQQSFNFAANKYGWKILEHEVEPNKLYKNISKYLSHKYSNIEIIRIANKVESRFFRLFLRIIILTPLILINLTSIRSLKNENLGSVQWVHFQKI